MLTNEELQKAIDKLYEIYNNERYKMGKILENFIKESLMRLVEIQMIRATEAQEPNLEVAEKIMKENFMKEQLRKKQ